MMKTILKEMYYETIDFFIKYKYIFKLTLVLLIFFFSSLFEEIPIFIFSIDKNTMSSTTDMYLNLFGDVVSLLILFLIYRKDLIDSFKVFWKNKLQYMDIGVRYWFLGLVVMGLSNFLISTFTPSSISNNESSIRVIVDQFPIISSLLIIVIAPIVEELTFRKAFRDAFNNKVLFLIMSSLIFGSLHVIFQSPTIYDYLFIIPYSSLGFSLAYMYYKTDNPWTSICIHILHNGIMTLGTIFLSGVIL